MFKWCKSLTTVNIGVMSKKTLESPSITEQVLLFCREYLKDLNGTQAAIRASYSEKTAASQASRLLRNAKVQAELQRLMKERAERVEVDADYVLRSIIETVERCKQATPVMEFDHDQKCMVETGEWKFEYSGVLKGCELLGKHLKMFTEKHEHSGPDGKPIRLAHIRSREEIEQELAILRGEPLPEKRAK